MQRLTSKEAVALDAVERLKNVVARRRLRLRRAVGRRALHARDHCACADRKGAELVREVDVKIESTLCT
jgi:hypothetical protein